MCGTDTSTYYQNHPPLALEHRSQRRFIINARNYLLIPPCPMRVTSLIPVILWLCKITLTHAHNLKLTRPRSNQCNYCHPTRCIPTLFLITVNERKIHKIETFFILEHQAFNKERKEEKCSYLTE